MRSTVKSVVACCAIQLVMGAGSGFPSQLQSPVPGAVTGFPSQNHSPTPPVTPRVPHGALLVAAADDQIYNDAGSTTTVSYSLVEGGLSTGSVDAGGNLDDDPALVDADGADNIPGSVDDEVETQASSPVVNAGSDSAMPADKFDLDGDGDTSEPIPTDIAGAGRFFNPTGVGNALDMGAYENGADNIARTRDPQAPSVPLQFEIPHPNPISASGELSFRLPASERVVVAIFDALGRLQQTLFSDRAQQDREYRLTIPAAGLASGVYFVRLRSATFDESRKFVVVR